MRRGVICCRYAGLMTPSRFVEVVSTATAQAFGLYPRKGVIAPGSDADVILFDPVARHVISARTHHSRIDTNIYQGKEIEGKVRHPRWLPAIGPQQQIMQPCALDRPKMLLLPTVEVDSTAPAQIQLLAEDIAVGKSCLQ